MSKRQRSKSARAAPARIGDMDQRTAAARVARELVGAIESDLGGDPSAAQSELAQRAAMVGAYCATCEQRLAMGEEIDVATWLAACNAQGRTLRLLGLERRARPIERGLSAYQAVADGLPTDEEFKAMPIEAQEALIAAQGPRAAGFRAAISCFVQGCGRCARKSPGREDDVI
jgi:hypothetical protein